MHVTLPARLHPHTVRAQPLATRRACRHCARLLPLLSTRPRGVPGPRCMCMCTLPLCLSTLPLLLLLPLSICILPLPLPLQICTLPTWPRSCTAGLCCGVSRLWAWPPPMPRMPDGVATGEKGPQGGVDGDSACHAAMGGVGGCQGGCHPDGSWPGVCAPACCGVGGSLDDCRCWGCCCCW